MSDLDFPVDPGARVHLPRLIERRLGLAQVRQVLDGRHVMAPEELAQATPAAVLVPIVNRPAGTTVLFTRRTDHLSDHAGQISFPGGRVEPDDASAEATALRETREEIGLQSDCIELLGRLPTYFIPTGYQVVPVVGWVEPPFELSLDPFEVAEAFEVPLDFLLDPHNHRRESGMRNGRMRQWYAMPYAGYNIWGATAGMLVMLSEALRGGAEQA